MEIAMIMLKTLVAAGFVAAVSPVNAQSIMDDPNQTFDLATVTCKQLMDLPTAGMGIRIMYWLDGYYRDDVEPAIIDTGKVKKMIVTLASYCEKNPTHGVITASETLFGKKK
jgi:hypothetical protein